MKGFIKFVGGFLAGAIVFAGVSGVGASMEKASVTSRDSLVVVSNSVFLNGQQYLMRSGTMTVEWNISRPAAYGVVDIVVHGGPNWPSDLTRIQGTFDNIELSTEFTPTMNIDLGGK